ncbi:MAG: YciI family protein [Ferruginibacter sp.]
MNINSSLLAQQNPKVDTANTAQRLEDKIKQYWFVLLKAGKNRTHDSLAAAKIQEGHMANINKLYYEGKLKVAGPFSDDGDWRGIFIFDCDTKEEVMNLLNTDPAIASGRLEYELHPWWTAAMGSFKTGKPIKN